MDNMKLWNAVCRPPATALKIIKGGRLIGMTDVNPQFRYQAMTEQFGVCGVGWKYEVVRLWLEPVPDGQILAFAEINLYTLNGNEWSAAIPGIGGSMLVVKESSGLHASDEAYKMAITDALSVAMKMLGVAADIYAGLWDGLKYNDEPKTQPRSTASMPSKSKSEPVKGKAEVVVSPPVVKPPEKSGNFDIDDIKTKMADIHWKPSEAVSWMKSKANYMNCDFSGSFSEILNRMSKEQVSFFLGQLDSRAEMMS